MTPPPESSLVFNIVWTGEVFTYLRYFTLSLLDRSDARYRFVANGCPPAQIALMEDLRRAHPDRVVEVLDVSPDSMEAHGVALDRVRAQRDDGDHFCLIDPDIKANAPFVGDLLRAMGDGGAVTSGREVWSRTNVLPENHPGVPGETFFDRDGFVFGSPHLAIYRRDALEDTAARWGVGLGSAGPDLDEAATEAMAAMGHRYLVYDTAKIVNALLQADGHGLTHHELPQVVHIGGLAHYLSPPAYRTDESGAVVPDWTAHETMADRHSVTRYAAQVLRARADGQPAPPPPVGLDADVEDRLALVHRELDDLMDRYGPTPARGPARRRWGRRLRAGRDRR